MKVALLVNPAARAGAHTGAATQAADRLRTHGVQTSILSGGSAAESSALLRAAIQVGVDAVAAGDGDGIHSDLDRGAQQRGRFRRTPAAQDRRLHAVGAQTRGRARRSACMRPGACGGIDEERDPHAWSAGAVAGVTRTPGFMMPVGSRTPFTARSTSTPSAPISASRYGRWSRPTA